MRTLSDLTHARDVRERARLFTRWIHAQGAADPSDRSAQRLIEAQRGGDRIAKAAIAATMTGDLAPLLSESSAFVAVASRQTVLGQMAGTLQAPPFWPVAGPALDPTAQWIGEGNPVPVARLTLSTDRTARAAFGYVLPFSADAFKFTDDRALDLIEQRTARANQRAEDALLLSDAAAVPDTSPAGLLFGLTPLGGGSPDSVFDDVQALWTAVSHGDPDSPYFIVSRRGAMYLRSLHEHGTPLFPDVGPMGGTIYGVPTIVAHAAANNLILIDATNLVVTDEGLVVASSDTAAVEMADTPTTASSTGTPAVIVSGFQTNTRFLRFTRYLSWLLLDHNSVAHIELPIGGSPS